MGFLNFQKNRIPAEVVGEKIANDAIPILTADEIADLQREFGIPDIQGFEFEFTILVCFMEVCVFDQVLGDNPNYAQRALDFFHDQILTFADQSPHLPGRTVFEEALPIRYAQYRKSAHMGLDQFVKQAPHDFISFLLGNEKATHFKNNAGIWAEALITIQWWIGLMLKQMTEGLSALKRDYKLGQ